MTTAATLKVKFETPNGQQLETSIASLRKYIGERIAPMIKAHRTDGMTLSEAEQATFTWATATLRGALENLARDTVVVDRLEGYSEAALVSERGIHALYRGRAS